MRQTKISRYLLAIVVALAMAASACSTGSGDDDTVTSTPTDPDTSVDTPTDDPPADDPPTDDPPTEEDPIDVPRTASHRGVGEDTIDIGVAFWDTSVFGFGFFGDPNLVWDPLIDAINADGGVNGRTLNHTIEGINPADTTGMLAACVSLTEDSKVFAVLGGMRGDANYCINEQHETILLGSQVSGEGEALERSRAPIGGFFPSGDLRESSFIDELDARGWFDGAESVGVQYDGQRTADRVEESVTAALTALDFDIALSLNIDDLGLDEDTLEAQIDIMREQARNADLDRVIIFGAAATGLITFAELGIQMAAVDSSNFTTVLGQGIDPSALDGTISTTARLGLDSDPIDAATQACLDTVSAAEPDLRYEQPAAGVINTEEDPNYWNYVVLACRDLELFVQAATASGVELTNDSFGLGLESLSETSLPQVPFVSFGPGKYNGGDTIRLVEFDADADEDGELVALADAVDLTP